MIFVLDYDRESGRIVQLLQFGDEQILDARETRLQLELRLNRERIRREVVLLDAENEDALRRTHRRYFESLEELATPLPAMPASE